MAHIEDRGASWKVSTLHLGVCNAAAQPRRPGLINSVAGAIASAALSSSGRQNLPEFLHRTDHYCRRFARELLHALLVAALLATFCSSSYANCSESDRKFIVGPHAAAPVPGLADQAHPLVFCNLLPGQTIHVTSLMLTADRRFFSSVQTFRIIDAELNTAKDAPIAGSYAGVEPDGYFWSMAETRDPRRDMLADVASDPTAIIVRAEIEKNGTVSDHMHRNFGQWLATTRDIREDGIVGKLFMPKRYIPGRAAVLMIPGAGGPNFQILAAYLLAARGFTVLSLPYYGLDGLPQQLESIPIEYFSRAVDFLRREHIGKDRKLFLLGISAGTQAAAMVALQRDDIAGLVLLSPSSVLTSGWGVGFQRRLPAWTVHGSALPFIPGVEGENDVMRAQTPPYRTRARYDLRLDKLAADDPSRIPFENVEGDVVLLACDQDEVSPSARMSAEIVDRTRRRGKRNVVSYVFPGCGHDLGSPVAPTTGRDFRSPSDDALYTLGGTAQAAWHGQKAAWSAILRHLGASEEN
jgi:pimeloyl-ACP methyl ester carboxylesterase